MRLAICLMLFSLPLLSLAAPAPYYKWLSRVDGQVTCQQASPGPGWELLDGSTYRDLRCTQPIQRSEQPGVTGFRSRG